MLSGSLCRVTGNSVTIPDGVMLAIRHRPSSVNHMFPSGPIAIPNGSLPSGRGNSVMIPDALISPIPSEPV
jgi:hypothetical protein